MVRDLSNPTCIFLNNRSMKKVHLIVIWGNPHLIIFIFFLNLDHYLSFPLCRSSAPPPLLFLFRRRREEGVASWPPATGCRRRRGHAKSGECWSKRKETSLLTTKRMEREWRCHAWRGAEKREARWVARRETTPTNDNVKADAPLMGSPLWWTSWKQMWRCGASV